MKRLLLISISMLCANQVFAYDCNQSPRYKEEYEAFAKIPPVDMDSLKVGVAFLVEHKHLTKNDADEKMLEILRKERPPLLMQIKSELDSVAARIKSASPTTEEECLGVMELRREHRRLGQQMTKYTVARLLASESPAQPSPPQCKLQRLAVDHVSEICLIKGANFDHDYFTLRVDSLEVFHIADDYVESVELKHKIPRDTSIEFPLSLQGSAESTLRGGCVPVEKDGVSVASICNFTWGNIPVVKDVRFDF
jgi:hypothetical protein